MRRIVLSTTLALALTLAGACADGRDEPAAVGTTTTTTVRPKDDPAVDRNVFASQNDLHVTPDGFRPLTMVALIDDPIGIVNDTPAPLVVRFTNYRTPDGLSETPPIPPGDRFSWTSDSGYSVVLAADGIPGQANIVIEPDALQLQSDQGGPPGAGRK